MGELYLGLMSGTSQDGVDAALITLDSGNYEIQRTSTTPYPESLRQRIESLLITPDVSLEELGGLDVAIAGFFADCVVRLPDDGGPEAVLFAWLARARLRGEPGNAPSGTGASRPAILGGVYYGVRR